MQQGTHPVHWFNKIKALGSLLCITAILSAFCLQGYCQHNPFEWKDGEDLPTKTARLLFLKVSVDKKEAFVGESIVAAYRLYLAADVQGQLAKAPSFRGFAAYDMQSADNEHYTVEQVNGNPYRVYLIKTVQLFGLKAGTQILEPIELDATVRYQKNTHISAGINGQPQDTLFNYTAKSAPIEVVVKPLPPLPLADKLGGVGDYSISLATTKPVVEANKTDTVTLTISGMGAWHQIVVPEISWPPGLETFEPAIAETVDPMEVPVQGRRTLQFPVVASKPGRYMVPPVKFTFFNPGLNQYITLKTDSVALNVVPETSPTGPRLEQPKSKDLTSLFGKFAMVLFPLTALVLIALVLFRKNKKPPGGNC